MKFNEITNKDFIKQFGNKVREYIKNIEVIGKKISQNDFSNSMETLEKINPKTIMLWEIFERAHSTMIFGNKEWTENVNWEHILQDLEPEITEIIDYFKTEYPTYFIGV